MRFVSAAFLSLCLVSFSLPANARNTIEDIRVILDKALIKDEGAHFDAVVDILISARPGQAAIIRNMAKGMKAAQVAPAEESEVVVEEKVVGGMIAPVARVAQILDFDKWDGSAEMGISALAGDTSEQAGTLGVRFDRAIGEQWEHKLNLNIDFARHQGQTSKERYAADYALKWRMSEHGYVYGLFDAEKDKFSGFQHRFAESIGVGYKLYEEPDFKWSIEGGPGLRQSKLDVGASDTNVIGVLSSKVRYWFTPDLSAGADGKIYVGHDRTSVQNILDMKAKINASLSARLSYQTNFDSNVPDGNHKLNTITRATIVYDF